MRAEDTVGKDENGKEELEIARVNQVEREER